LVRNLSKSFPITLDFHGGTNNDLDLIHNLSEYAEVRFEDSSEVIIQNVKMYYKYNEKYYCLTAQELFLGQYSFDDIDEKLVNKDFIIFANGGVKPRISKIIEWTRIEISENKLNKKMKARLNDESLMNSILVWNKDLKIKVTLANTFEFKIFKILNIKAINDLSFYILFQEYSNQIYK